MPSTPQNSSDNREQTSEAVLPGMRECKITNEQVGQQACPDLPLHSVGVVAEKISQLNGLFDFLEEHLNVPATSIQFRDSPGAPLYMIGQKLQLAIFPIHFNQRNNPSHGFGVGLAGFLGDQFNDLVAQDSGIIGGVQGFNHAILHVVLGATDSENAVMIHGCQVIKIHIGLVKHHYFSGLKSRAQIPCLGVVVKFGCVNNDALGRKL